MTTLEATAAEPTTVEKLKGLPWSIFANAANTVFAQFTIFGSVFVLFLSELGMNKAQIGFMLSFIPFAGLVALFIAPAVAHYGYKRTYITFFGIRKIVTMGLLLTPWVLAVFGQQGVLIFVTSVMAGFSITRAIAETGVYPWLQEYIPNSVRGKYSATNSIYTTLVGLASVAIAGVVVERSDGLTGYMWLIAVGVIFGFISVWASTFIPGGAPTPRTGHGESVVAGMWEAGHDRNFLRYLAGAALITLGTVPMISFLPLYMSEEIMLSSGGVVWLQAGTLVGVLVTSLPWGWAADRYGSKPVMLSGLAMKVLLPIMWFAMPRDSASSLYVALAIAFLLGVSDIGWAIGAGRLLFVSVVPPHKKMEYMALHYAWIGVIGGFSQLIGGWVLDYASEMSAQALGFVIDPYTPLFVMGFVLTLATIVLLRKMRADNVFGVGQFAGMFFRGNPFLAMNAMIRYYLAKDERATISMTERLGQAKSPLAVDELLETLNDPRFNVRYEAIISISRMPPDPRLTDALIEILDGTELATSTAAAWDLGRIGDANAVEALRAALDSPYQSIRAHAGRALGSLHDAEVEPLLLQRLEVEQDKGLQMAYASALGHLRSRQAVPQVLTVLHATTNPGARMELALSLARIVGEEHFFIQLLRQVRTDAGTAAAQALSSVKKKVDKAQLEAEDLAELMSQAVDRFARQDLDHGARLMGQAILQIPRDSIDDASAAILHECALRMEESGAARQEYLLLALHTLNVGAMF